MASFCRSAAASAARSAAAAARTKVPSLSKSSRRAPLPTSRPVYAALGCAVSFIPLHSAVAAARLRSCIAADTSCWCWTAQGLKDDN